MDESPQVWCRLHRTPRAPQEPGTQPILPWFRGDPPIDARGGALARPLQTVSAWPRITGHEEHPIMRNYRSNAATEARVFFGVELVAGLTLFPETTPLAPPFEQLNDQLDGVLTSREASQRPVLKARAKVRFASYVMAQTIRSAARAAEIADGGRRGALFGALFPKGLTSAVPGGRTRQKTAADALLDRLTKTKVAGSDAFRTEWLPKLTDKRGELSQALDALGAAQAARQDILSTESALRAQHRVEVARIIGQVRAAFPEDCAKQDAIFPEEERPASAAEPEASEPKAAPTPAPTPAEPTAPKPA